MKDGTVIQGHTAESLHEFEQDVASAFNNGRIRAPVHLAGGNEDTLIEIFRDIRPQDWIACSWRSHYHCLLKGVPRDELMAEILAGRSITLCFPGHRVVSSAIVGGVLPIALGLAWSAKRAGRDERVWAFCGDMTSMGGMFHECHQYAMGHLLPITFVVEDNGKSVCTDTRQAWGTNNLNDGDGRFLGYSYGLPWPHAGAGRRIQF